MSPHENFSSLDLDDVSCFVQHQVAHYTERLLGNGWHVSQSISDQLYTELMMYCLEDDGVLVSHKKEAIRHTIGHAMGMTDQRARHPELKNSTTKRVCQDLLQPSVIVSNSRLRCQHIAELNEKIFNTGVSASLKKSLK